MLYSDIFAHVRIFTSIFRNIRLQTNISYNIGYKVVNLVPVQLMTFYIREVEIPVFKTLKTAAQWISVVRPFPFQQ